MGKELTRRLALMTGAAAIAAGWDLPAVAFPRSRPPTSRAKMHKLLVTSPFDYSFYDYPRRRPPFNCRCSVKPLEMHIGFATFHSDMVMDERHTALRIEVDCHSYPYPTLESGVEVHKLVFYDRWTTWLAASPDSQSSFFLPDADSHRWTWQPTVANTQGLMMLQFPGSPHQAVNLHSAPGSINLINADSLVGDIDIAQLI